MRGHAFDCYVELLHNNIPVARAFGEAKNYELLSSHFNTFKQWLDDVNFKPFTSDGIPPDLAFMIAPSCSPLLQRKLELRNIRFIQSDKAIAIPIEVIGSTSRLEKIDLPATNWISSTFNPDTTIISDTSNATNINTANKYNLTEALKGTGIRQATIDRIIKLRPYKNLDVMVSKLKFTLPVKSKLQNKLDIKEICF